MRTKQRLFVLLALLALPFGWLAWPAAVQPKEDTPGAADAVTIAVNKANIEFRVNKDEAAIYEYGGDLAKPYFWPLNASNNKHVTRDWPMLQGTAARLDRSSAPEIGLVHIRRCHSRGHGVEAQSPRRRRRRFLVGDAQRRPDRLHSDQRQPQRSKSRQR